MYSRREQRELIIYAEQTEFKYHPIDAHECSFLLQLQIQDQDPESPDDEEAIPEAIIEEKVELKWILLDPPIQELLDIV